MRVRFDPRPKTPPRLICTCVLAWLAATPPLPAAELRWLAELGAESLVASPRPPGTSRRAIVVSVPGAAYVFTLGPDGSLLKRRRLAADPAAPYGVAATETGLVLADRQGIVGLWSLSGEGAASLRWRRDLGDRVTSVGWDGGELVLVATWKGRLVAMAAADGRILWSADIGGRAEAPAVTDGRDVFIASKARALLRLDASTGVIRWKVALPGVALHPPVPFGEKPHLVLCGTWEGQLLAYDAPTGHVRWSASLPAKLASAPVAASDLVAAVTADGTVHAYDSAGNARWTALGSADGATALLLEASTGAAPRLVSVSKVLVGLDLAKGARLADYPHGAVEELRRRFAEAMLDGLKTYSEAEKHAILDREAFEISGPLFARARVFGPYLAFGTDDGWAYVFDAATLRPLARYRAGQACSGIPRLAAGRAVAVAGEEVFGLEPLTGKTLWRRVLGPDSGPVAGEATLAIVAGGRVHAIGAADGVLQWSLRGRFRSVTPPAAAASEGASTAPWLVDDGEGNLRALLPPGRLVGDPLPAGGDLLPIVASSERSWIAATREGKVFGVDWEEPAGGAGGAPNGRLVKSWETAFDERILEVQLADGRMIVRSEAGTLAGVDAASRQELWRVRVSKEDRVQALPRVGALLSLGTDAVRVHDWASGEVRFQQKVASPAVAADLRGTSLRWLDRWGGAHRVDVQDGRPEYTADLGVPLVEAARVPGGFLVTTAAGEVGFVDVGDEPSAAAAGKGS